MVVTDPFERVLQPTKGIMTHRLRMASLENPD